MTLRALNRLAPLPAATVTTHLEPFAPKPTPAQLVETWNENAATLERRLTAALAELYGHSRVRCSAAVEPSQRQERHQEGGRVLTGNGAPTEQYMRTGQYLQMWVSVAMARRLLERDGGLTGVS